MALDYQKADEKATKWPEKERLYQEKIDSIAKKVACTLAECKATYADVNRIFSRVGRYLVLDAIDTID